MSRAPTSQQQLCLDFGLSPDRSSDSSSKLLHAIFEQTAERAPAGIAVVCGNRQMTYGELELRANQVARLLKTRGIGPGDCVGLCLPRSIEVFVALLGILKAGAAYVPLDPEYPAERMIFILSDCRARALLTVTSLAEKTASFEGFRLLMDKGRKLLKAQSGGRLQAGRAKANGQDLCYIIYTSGTTGRPKGVQIEHRSAHHLVCAERELFGVQARDRVYQGFSIAFDASVEEVWLAFSTGATLVAATAEMVHAGAGLSRLLTEARVTVLSCVPTLLSMMEEDVPSVRLLILGGEACPPDLVKRWWKPGRRVFNTYGPTEATVIATCAECHPGEPVTIGRPLPGYRAWILDEKLHPVTDGLAGELCLGGVGLARGYAGRPELDRQKFVTGSFHGEPPQRLYRTGDLAKWTADEEIEFLGRIDTQVKIRGFRVELSEIESVLLECDGVQAAAVTVLEIIPGLQQLVAYVVATGGVLLEEAGVRSQLQKRLPAYMVPAWIETLEALPALSSGKVDRKRLPAPKARSAARRAPVEPPRSDAERTLAEAWTRLFAPAAVSIHDDFFLDLGGHSLLAARMVSELRKTGRFARLSMGDVYRWPTIEQLAKQFEQKNPTSEPQVEGSEQRQGQIPFWRHFWCGAAQAVSLVFVLSFFALQWLTPYLTYTVMVEEEYSFLQAVLGAFASLIVFYPLMVAVPIAIKWLVIGRYKPGSYPLWGTFYFRWWLATTIEAAVPVSYLAGTPLMNLYLRLMGSRVGGNVHLASNSFCIYDLVSIGDDSSINVDSTMLGYTVENGFLELGRITIGKGCLVGTRAAMREDSTLEDGAALEDLSLLPRGGLIPAGETWSGSPARLLRRDPPQASEPVSAGRRCVFGVLHGAGLLLFPVLVVAALFPGIVLMNQLNYIDPYYWYLLLAPLVGLSFVVLLALEIAAVKWLVLGRVRAGSFPVFSPRYLRKWFVDQTIDLSLDVLGPLYASIYLAPWYKLLGAKLGKGAEVSTASFISPDLLSIGEESFIADSVSLGAARVRNGVVTLGPNEIGKRSFIGNSALLPPGSVIGDKVLIGCLSVPPVRPGDALREDSSWLGSPALFLPQRQQSAGFSDEVTFNPPARLQALRALIEFVRVITPSTAFIILISLLFSALLLLRDRYNWFETLLFFPALYLGCAFAAALVAIVGKWFLVGRYRPGEKPLWSSFVWRNELVNALHEHLAEPFLIAPLSGTPFICWYFRLLGAHIGRRVYLETTDICEFDLARIGDEAMLNADCTVQTHLFEDRVMKMDRIEIGSGCHVGAGSLVLYDTRMEPGAALGDLSLLMKGETLPGNTCWEGVPARAAHE